jgi:subtilisin family serine protease
MSFSIVASSSTPAIAQREQIPEFVPGQVIVSFKPSASSHQVEELFDSMSKSHGVNKIRDLDHKVQNSNDLQEKLVKVPAGQERKLMKILEKNPNVEHAGLNYIVHVTDTIPNDTRFSELWGLHNTGQTGGTSDADIDAPLAWDIFTGSDTVVVGVVDTGIDYTHPDLVANIWTNPGEIAGNGIDDDGNGYVDDIHGIDTVNGDSDPIDDHDHGTHVAGTIGGVGNNGDGVTGVNWDVTMIACKFLSSSGSGSTAGAIECFNYFANLGIVDITNNSWGGGGYNQALVDSMAVTPNTLHVIAAGNDNNDNDAGAYYPANNPISNKLVVAASDHNDNMASFSSYGDKNVDLAAPGVSILSSTAGGGYASFSGTSMATPQVAGAAALIWGNDPSLSQDKIQDIIRCNTDPISDPKLTKTNGRLNIGNALESGDSTSPSSISDLAVVETGFSTAKLSFTSTGDDGNSGTASCYEIRYSTSPIDSETDWNNSNNIFLDTDPKSPGNSKLLTVKGLEPETTYHFAAKVGDNYANFSPISNTVSGTTGSGQVAFEDDMELFNPSNWASDGLWHTSDNRANSGQWSWHYADQGLNTYDVNLTPSGNSGTLETKAIDLTDATEAQLSFAEWIEVELTPAYDRTRVGISTDGIFFTTVHETLGPHSSWRDITVDLSDYVGQQIYVGFNFDTVDNQFNEFEGWYIDDVKVIKYVPGSEPIENIPPTADAGGPYSETVGNSITFDGSGSSDTDGTVTNYDWDFGDGNTGTGVSPTHSYAAAGTYTVTLTVEDNDSALSAPVTSTAEISDVPAGLSISITNPIDGSNLEGKVTITTDVTGGESPITVEFFINGVKIGEDSSSPYQTQFHSKDYSGDLTIEVIATDNNGDTDTDSIQAQIPPKGGGSGGGGSDKCHPKKGCPTGN